jgi:hypothetical protein
VARAGPLAAWRKPSGRFIREGLIGEAEVHAVLVDAARLNGLVATNGSKDVLRDIRRGFEAGAADPLPPLGSR